MVATRATLCRGTVSQKLAFHRDVQQQFHRRIMRDRKGHMLFMRLEILEEAPINHMKSLAQETVAYPIKYVRIIISSVNDVK